MQIFIKILKFKTDYPRGKWIIATPMPNADARQPTFSPYGSSESPTPRSARSARVVRMGGWVDRWMDGLMGGDQNCASILFTFKYINTQTVLIPNMVLKVVYGFYIRIWGNLRAISPAENGLKNICGKCVSAPQKLSDISKKLYQKTMISASKI